MRGTKRSRRSDDNGFEAWGGYMNAKIQKLEEQFSVAAAKVEGTSEKLSNIFEGVSIFVNGYTEPSADELKLLMMLHGGTYHHYQRSKTTHVIATNLPNSKMHQLKTLKIVKPNWITESIAAGNLLDYKQFILFNSPSAIQEGFKNAVEKQNMNENKGVYTGSTLPAIVKSPGRGEAKTAANSQFLSEFYNNSRLHHLSTMGAMFKQYVGELRQKHDGNFPGRGRLSKWKLESSQVEVENEIEKINHNIIMHIDMDCFFVSVALRSRPELVGQPVAVTHARGNQTHHLPGVDRRFEYEFYKNKRRKDKAKKIQNTCKESSEDEDEESEEEIVNEGTKPRTHWTEEKNSRSEISSCSYEARKAGVRNGMYLGSAYKLCPNLKTVPYDFEGYKEVSFVLYNTIAEYTLDIEAVSCDELFVDCSAVLTATKCTPLEFAAFLRGEIREKTKCPSSTGLGSNKLQARLATKRAKPDGHFYLMPSLVSEFMAEVDIHDLPGVGWTLGERLRSLNVTTCADLQNIPLDILKKEIGGKTGLMLYKFCRGIDDRTVKSSHQRKSVSAEVNYGIRFTNNDEALTFLKQLSGEVSNRLKEIKMKGRSLTLKIMIRAKGAPAESAKFMGHGACDQTARSAFIPLTDDPQVIAKHVMTIFSQMSLPPSELRGIGIQLSKLEPAAKTGSLHNFLKAKTEVKPMPKESKNVNIDKLQLPPASQLDRNVIQALPDDIRLEIMNQYGLSVLENQVKPSTSKELRYSNIDQDILVELPKELREEIEERYSKKKSEMEKSPWQSVSTKEVRTMIREWVKSEESPKELDVDMLIQHVRCLVRTKNIEEVSILLKCFSRHVQEMRENCQMWQSAYQKFEDCIQNTMVSDYGGKLKI